MSSTPVTAAPDRTSARHKFMVLPVIVLILAQMGTTGDNGALSLATSALTRELGATTSDIQLANMIYPLVGGAFMIAGGSPRRPRQAWRTPWPQAWANDGKARV